MRSKIGTKSRLAAHITALILLILLLVNIQAPPPQDQPHFSGPSRSRPPARAQNENRAPARRAEAPGQQQQSTAKEPETPAPAPRTVAAPDPAAVPASDAVPEPAQDNSAEPGENSQSAADTEKQPGDAPAAVETEPAGAEPAPQAAQPDESGALVVAAPEGDAAQPVAALSPLGDANLEVLGDNVYWLDPRHDLEIELAAIPEIGTLILLTPLPGYRAPGFEHVRTEIIPADAADLSFDAAARFVRLTAEPTAPVVAAVLPGARGAAFFKGAYLLANRRLELVDALSEIEPELAEAGSAAEEILHRLRRLDVTALR